MNETTLLILIILVIIGVSFIVPQLMVRFAVPKVIRILRQHGATEAANAALAADMGLAEKAIWERALKRRDFKPRALMALIHLGVVRHDDDGKVYLCEDELAKTIWKDQ